MSVKEVFSPQYRVKKKLNHFIMHKKSSGIKKYIYMYLRDLYAIKYGVEIGVTSDIEGPINFPHPRNIVIGENTVIGKNFTVYNNVTIGQKNGRYPVIGNNVTIYPGSVIVGDISIGDNVVIGANSFVNKCVNNNAVVAGNPAKELRGTKNEV